MSNFSIQTGLWEASKPRSHGKGEPRFFSRENLRKPLNLQYPVSAFYLLDSISTRPIEGALVLLTGRRQNGMQAKHHFQGNCVCTIVHKFITLCKQPVIMEWNCSSL